ncbi:MAG TPA: response regulator [Tepidisphaeraceae bacterium]|nr:response regulator [Tepidisphaeraceae bacterium]
MQDQSPTDPAPHSTHNPAGEPVAAVGQDGRGVVQILLVEDHEDTGRLIARLLKGSGYEVDHATDIASALDLFRKKSFQLVISDLGLPDGSGLELMRQIRAIHQQVPGICMSGYGTDGDLADSREAGFNEHLVKPVDLKILEATISRISGGR